MKITLAVLKKWGACAASAAREDNTKADLIANYYIKILREEK